MAGRRKKGESLIKEFFSGAWAAIEASGDSGRENKRSAGCVKKNHALSPNDGSVGRHSPIATREEH